MTTVKKERSIDTKRRKMDQGGDVLEWMVVMV